MAEWSIAAVLKTVEGNTSGGSNPSFSAKGPPYPTKSPQTVVFVGFLIFNDIGYYQENSTGENNISDKEKIFPENLKKPLLLIALIPLKDLSYFPG